MIYLIPRSLSLRLSLGAGFFLIVFLASFFLPNQTAASTATAGTSRRTFAMSRALAMTSCPWASAEVGNVGAAGSATCDTTTTTVRGGGADIWDAADAFHFEYQSITGDGQIVARMASQQNTNAWAKAGLMMRENLTASAKHASIFLTPFNGSIFQHRLEVGAGTTFMLGTYTPAPYWLKLVRAGNMFTGYTSADGATWKLIGTQSVVMANTIYVGLAVSSHLVGTLGTVSFTNIAYTGSSVVTPTPAPSPTPTPMPTPTPTPTPIPAPTPTPTPTATAGNQFYVSPTGTAGGDGSIGNPWNLATALAQPASVKPGATIWVRGGTYAGAFVSNLTGTETAPITVRAYPGERPMLDGIGYDYTKNPLTVNGAYAIYWGLEVMNSSQDRSTRRAGAINVFGAHTKFINNILHDACEGLGVWTSAIDAELYGNIIFNGGWQGASPDRGHGHGVYTQNNTGTKVYRDNVIFNQYGFGFHAYTEGGSIKGFLLDGNVSFNNGQPVREHTREANILVGGLQPADRITLQNNFTFHPADTNSTNVQLHYYAAGNQNLTVQGNYFLNGNMTVSVKDWLQASFTNNVITGRFGVLTMYKPAGAAASCVG
ncbi:MAG: hypothetical protein U0Y68_02215 [Blastocatellia bacterium]